VFHRPLSQYPKVAAFPKSVFDLAGAGHVYRHKQLDAEHAAFVRGDPPNPADELGPAGLA
jgi:hypothetical protein